MDVKNPSHCRPYLFVGIVGVTVTAGVFLPCRALGQSLLRSTTRPSKRAAQQCKLPSTHSRSSSNAGHTMSAYGQGTGVTVPSHRAATAAIIFLHGLGDTGAGWAPAFPLRDLLHVRTILPTANVMPVSLNAGMPMPSWFDLHGLDADAKEDETGLLSAVARVDSIVDAVISDGIPASRIVVAGFSQGGAVALTSGLRTSRKLAGVIALSCWLPLRQKALLNVSETAKSAPVFMGHGVMDNIVPFSFGQMSAGLLKNAGIDLEFSSYPDLSHSSSAAELNDVAKFAAKVLPPL